MRGSVTVFAKAHIVRRPSHTMASRVRTEERAWLHIARTTTAMPRKSHSSWAGTGDQRELRTAVCGGRNGRRGRGTQSGQAGARDARGGARGSPLRLQCARRRTTSPRCSRPSARISVGRGSSCTTSTAGRSTSCARRSSMPIPRSSRDTILNSAFSAFLVGQQAAKAPCSTATPDASGHRGTIIFTNASAAFKGYPLSGAFAIASHGKSGTRREHGAGTDARGHPRRARADRCRDRVDATGRHALAPPRRHDGRRQHGGSGRNRRATYLFLHRQPRSTWGFEIVLRPWTENW